MGLFLQYKLPTLHWAVWKIEEPMDMLLNFLPESQRLFYQQEMMRFTSERRKIEWISVRVLLFAMLQEDKIISYSAEGKPFLTDQSYSISISHTKGYVAVILSSQNAVGADIEQYSKRVQRLCGRFMRPDEITQPYLGDLTWSMLLHWSAKESVFKCMEHADADLRKLRVLPFKMEKEGVFQVCELVTVQRQTFSVHYQICPDFVFTWLVGSMRQLQHP